jgi:transcriptional regulator with XRE-family HTH domain
MPNIFADVLKRLMDERAISQYRLAIDAKLQQSTISRILSKQTDPTWTVAVKIAETLGVSLDTFAEKKSRKK